MEFRHHKGDYQYDGHGLVPRGDVRLFTPEELRRRLDQAQFLKLGEDADEEYDELDLAWTKSDLKEYDSERAVEWTCALNHVCPDCGAGVGNGCMNSAVGARTRFPPHEARIYRHVLDVNDWQKRWGPGEDFEET